MPRLEIDSLDDPRLDPYRSLKTTNRTRDAGLFVAEGTLVVQRLLESGLGVESVVTSDRREPAIAEFVPPEVPLFVVPHELGERLVGFDFHVGLLACGRRPPSPALAETFDAEPDRLRLVVCPNVDDPENLGSILRLSAAFGLDAVLLGDACCDPWSRRVLRVSMGAAFSLPIVRSSNVLADLATLRNRNVATIATVLDPTAEPLAVGTWPHRLAICFGNERHGLAPNVVAACDRRVTIPMSPKTDSLNVAIAAGIVLWAASPRG